MKLLNEMIVYKLMNFVQANSMYIKYGVDYSKFRLIRMERSFFVLISKRSFKAVLPTKAKDSVSKETEP